MKRSNTFSSPQRQSKFAIIFIILRLLRNLFRQLWPFVIAIFLGRGNSSFDTLEIILSGLGIFGIFPSLVAYYKFYFHLSDNELIINKGLFKKVKLNIPFERIQSVNFRQTFIHQFFKVTEVEIETAGSAEQETKIDAIDIPLAQLLRQRILEKKAEVSGQLADVSGDQAEELNKETILRLSQKDLVRVGFVQNHFKPIGLLAGLIGSLSFYFYTFDFDPRDYYDQAFSFGEQLPITYIAIIVVLLIIASISFSLITTFLKYYNLHFWRSGKKFQVVQGLLTRKEFAALDNKVQILNWGQNPFERILGFYNIIFRQARSGDEKKKTTQFKIPGCNSQHVQFVKEAWLGKETGDFSDIRRVTIHLFYHTAFYQCIVFSLLLASSVYTEEYLFTALIGIIFILALWLNWLNYSKTKFAINDHEIYIGGGTIGLRHALLPMYKVQDVKITENPYQWRRGLATLLIHTAAGTVSIPYIPRQDALRIMDLLIFNVERSSEAWI